MDRWCTMDFKDRTFGEQLDLFKKMAQVSANQIGRKLTKALENHKSVYILTHVPPWKEATRDEGTLFEKFWFPSHDPKSE